MLTEIYKQTAIPALKFSESLIQLCGESNSPVALQTELNVYQKVNKKVFNYVQLLR